MYSLFFPVLKGQSLVNYRDYMVNSFLITSSKENIDRSTIRTRAVCPVLDVLFAGQIDRNSGMFTLPEIQKWHSTGANKREKRGPSMYPELTFTYIIKISSDPPPRFFFFKFAIFFKTVIYFSVIIYKQNAVHSLLVSIISV